MNTAICLACGQELSEPLAAAGSLRCQDCRDADAPLDPALCASPPTPTKPDPAVELRQ
jgi:hypothetical protein